MEKDTVLREEFVQNDFQFWGGGGICAFAEKERERETHAHTVGYH